MVEAKPTAKKPAAKRPAAKKTAVKKAPPKKMNAYTRSFAARVTGAAVEAALADENLGVKRSAEKELVGRRTGMVSRIVLDDKTVITVTVAIRQK